GDLVQALENGDAVLEDRPLGMGGQRQREERGAGRRRARPPHGSPPPWLKIMWPIRSSRLTADWVSVTSSPGSSISMSPPGTSARYLPPRSPLLTTAAEVSAGRRMSSRRLKRTSAR